MRQRAVVTRQLDKHDANVQGTLFVAGMSDCGAEFHLGSLVSLSARTDHDNFWPDSKRSRFKYGYRERTANTLASLLNNNDFQLVVLVNLVHPKQMTKHKRLADSLHNAVTAEGWLLLDALRLPPANYFGCKCAPGFSHLPAPHLVRSMLA